MMAAGSSMVMTVSIFPKNCPTNRSSPGALPSLAGLVYSGGCWQGPDWPWSCTKAKQGFGWPLVTFVSLCLFVD